jgi:hypothetical protein
MPEEECACGFGDGWMEECIDGFVYGLCESEHCDGVCVIVGRCNCVCHARGTGTP